MNSTTKSWGRHYSRYLGQDGDRTLMIMDMNGMRIKHNLMQRSWQSVQQRYQWQPVHNLNACCQETGLHRGRSVPMDRCYLNEIKESVNETMRKKYGDISNLNLDEDDETSHDIEQKAKPKPIEPKARASGSRDDDDDDDTHYGIMMCMSY